MNRETLYADIFGLASSTAEYVVKSRRLRHWNDVQPTECPAFFQLQKGETHVQQRGVPPKITLNLEWYIYVNTSANYDPSVAPSVLINPLLDKVQEMFSADYQRNECVTLGGLVSHCWIDSIEVYEGLLGDIAVAIISVSALTQA